MCRDLLLQRRKPEDRKYLARDALDEGISARTD
jgi:hypothetical protein